ncbi:MAG TPA: hypothetical protein VLK84_11685 [Longimicrobium sp.]|nr:hypothetical protein [Longimicrobium sp.]
MMGRDDEAGDPRPRDEWERSTEELHARDVAAAQARRGGTSLPPAPGTVPADGMRVTPPAEGETDFEKMRRDPGSIRAEDTEPYVGLQYVARLFKIVAMIVIVAIIAEVVAGLMYEGVGAGFNLFAEVIQGGVLAAMLWGAGDLTLLFIDVGHDVRAARVLLGRMSTRMNATEMGGARQRSESRSETRDGSRDGRGEARGGDLPPAEGIGNR